MGITITIEFVRNPEYEYEPDKELYGNDMKMYKKLKMFHEINTYSEYRHLYKKDKTGNYFKVYTCDEAISKYIELHNGYYLTDDRVEDHIDLMKLFRTIADEI
jgi:hypothetical protein